MNDRDVIELLLIQSPFTSEERQLFVRNAVAWVEQIRRQNSGNLMELLMAEYGIDNEEGIALMCLAEALLRIPDSATMSALISDKIVTADWKKHLGSSKSFSVNASTWALLLTGKLLKKYRSHSLHSSLIKLQKKYSVAIIRAAVLVVVKELGKRFIFADSIRQAGTIFKGAEQLYSFDMLGESAVSDIDAAQYFRAYQDAIITINNTSTDKGNTHLNHGISIKLSALYSRYELAHKEDCNAVLIDRVTQLAELAMQGNIGLNIDAEEDARLALSQSIIAEVLKKPQFEGWHGFGIVVQTYNKKCLDIIKWWDSLARQYDRKVSLRLVKGAYWDSEIKHAQVEGLENYPVFSHKSATDIAYLCCCKYLLFSTTNVYPQFASHNAHTLAAVFEMAKHSPQQFEVQRLHGMGVSLHKIIAKEQSMQTRIYAPIGNNKDLLAYLVRRILENGANSSFVNQILDENVSPKQLVQDPFLSLNSFKPTAKSHSSTAPYI